MYFMLFVSIAIIVYVFTFKNDFNEEDMSKALPFILVVCLLLFAISIVSSINSGR